MKLTVDANHQFRARQRQRLAGWNDVEQLRQRHERRPSSAVPMPNWTVRREKPGDDARAEPGTGAGGGNEKEQGAKLDADRGDEDDRLHDRRQHVADVERPGNLLIGDQAPELVRGRRLRERSDAERIEEVGDETDGQVQRRRCDRLVRPMSA